MEALKATMEIDYKGGKMKLVDTMPNLTTEEDYVKQYHGIWRVLTAKVEELNATKVLEFGTREGYSTQIFSQALKKTGGDIITVDKDQPKEREKLLALGNVFVARSTVEKYLPHNDVDILYIDDWHNPWHLYWELNTFAHRARVVMIHDVCLESGQKGDLLRAIQEWCIQNMVIWTVYPVNQCGLAVLEIEKSKNFHQERVEVDDSPPQPLETEWMHKLPEDIKPEIRHEPGAGL